MGKLDGQVALITGGASGLGEATAELFTAEGARVVIADLQQDKGEALAGRLGDEENFVRTDVTSEGDIRAAIDYAVKKHGRLDCLFNNAGIPGVTAPIEGIDTDGFDHTMSVLVRAVLLGMKYATPVMKRQGGGNIISTASVAALTTVHSTPHVYNLAKAAVVHLTRSVALELGEHNIRVNCICPGFIATPIFATGGRMPDEIRAQIPKMMEPILAKQQPIKRSGQPMDIANAALWLASEDSSFVTGHALVVDGGVVTGTRWDPESVGGAKELREALQKARS